MIYIESLYKFNLGYFVAINAKTSSVCLQVTNASKLRVDLRFFADLVSVGVFSEKVGLPILANLLTFLLSTDKEEHNNLPVILSFSKHCGDDYAGLVPRKVRYLVFVPELNWSLKQVTQINSFLRLSAYIACCGFITLLKVRFLTKGTIICHTPGCWQRSMNRN